MDPRISLARVMARVALADGVVTDDEHDLLVDLVGDRGRVAALLEEVGDSPLDSLVSAVDSYADRFFIALRCRIMAHIDAVFSPSERRVLDELSARLGIVEDDLRLIEDQTHAVLDGDNAPAPRIRELYRESSFAPRPGGEA